MRDLVHQQLPPGAEPAGGRPGAEAAGEGVGPRAEQHHPGVHPAVGPAVQPPAAPGGASGADLPGIPRDRGGLAGPGPGDHDVGVRRVAAAVPAGGDDAGAAPVGEVEARDAVDPGHGSQDVGERTPGGQGGVDPVADGAARVPPGRAGGRAGEVGDVPAAPAPGHREGEPGAVRTGRRPGPGEVDPVGARPGPGGGDREGVAAAAAGARRADRGPAAAAPLLQAHDPAGAGGRPAGDGDRGTGVDPVGGEPGRHVGGTRRRGRRGRQPDQQHRAEDGDGRDRGGTAQAVGHGFSSGDVHGTSPSVSAAPDDVRQMA